MDPFSQGALGAAVAQSFAKNPTLKAAAICGALGGLAPDLDIVIRSSTDPLLSLEYHRQFTHSLAFVPVGGAIVSAALWFVFRYRPVAFPLMYLFTTLGFATHGLLDSCTAYGTSLLWPFSDARLSWNVISIVDPLFTLPLIVLVILATRRRLIHYAQIGFIFALAYLGFGAIQHWRVDSFMEGIAAERGHKIERRFVNTVIGNSIVWRSVYQSGDTYYIDGVTVWPFVAPELHNGNEAAVLDPETVYPEVGQASVQRKDIRRFHTFAQGFLYYHPSGDYTLGDLRYGGAEANDLNSPFGIRLDPDDSEKHVRRLMMFGREE